MVELRAQEAGNTVESLGGPSTSEMMKVTEISDDALLTRMMAGDEGAFVLLVPAEVPGDLPLRAAYEAATGASPRMLTQEAFMALIRDASSGSIPSRARSARFLFGIARNHLRKRWEQDRRLVMWGEDEPDTAEMVMDGGRHGEGGNGNGSRFPSSGPRFTPRSASAEPPGEFGDLSTADAASRVRQAVAMLPGKYREAVVLCDLEEMSYEEAAAALGCPIGTVRSRLHRARAILLEKLREAPARRPQPVRK